MPNEQFGEKPRQHGLISQDFNVTPKSFYRGLVLTVTELKLV